MNVFVNFHQLLSTRAKREQEFMKLSSTLMKNLSTFKVYESAGESMRVHESSMQNEREFELSSTLILVWTGREALSTLTRVNLKAHLFFYG